MFYGFSLKQMITAVIIVIVSFLGLISLVTYCSDNYEGNKVYTFYAKLEPVGICNETDENVFLSIDAHDNYRIVAKRPDGGIRRLSFRNGSSTIIVYEDTDVDPRIVWVENKYSLNSELERPYVNEMVDDDQPIWADPKAARYHRNFKIIIPPESVCRDKSLESPWKPL